MEKKLPHSHIRHIADTHIAHGVTKKLLDELTHAIIGCAIEVHKQLGPGLLESAYSPCMSYELSQRNLKHENEIVIPFQYKEIFIDSIYRLDKLVEELIVVELKSVEAILPVHEAQILTYMKLLQKPKGILINFNSTNIFHKGQKTFVNEIYAMLP